MSEMNQPKLINSQTFIACIFKFLPSDLLPLAISCTSWDIDSATGLKLVQC